MPQRPRSHQLETESKRAFERIIPSAWVYRDVIGGDYGIDGEVEIFDEGRATGESIKIQLKGTDSRPSKAGAHSVSVEFSTLSYWRKLDTPVLVVLYSAVDGSVYARWAESYNRDPARGSSPRTASFKFTARDRLNPTISPGKLRRELATIRALRAQRIPSRVGVSISSFSDIAELNQKDIEAKLRMAIYRTDGMLALKEIGEADVYVVIKRPKIVAALIGDVASCTMHLDKDFYSRQNSADTICSDVMMAVAMLLFRVGRSELGASIALEHMVDSHMAKDPDCVDEVFQNLMADGLVFEGWQLVKPFLISSKGRSVGPHDFWFSQVIFHEDFKRLSMDVRVDIAETVEKIGENLASAGEASGAILYSAGQVFEAIGRKLDAIRLFVRASEVDPGYLERGYFHREIGGLYFEQCRYDLAVDHYRRAIAVDGPAETPYLLSDALMREGRFGEASKIHFEIPSMHQFYQAGARIQQVTIRRIAAMVGVEKQVRVPLSSEKLAAHEPFDDIEKIVSLLRDTDALDPRLWFHSIFLQADSTGALESALITAYLIESNPQVWLWALLIALRVEEGSDYSADICQLAFRHCSGSQLLEAVEDLESLAPEDKDALRDQIIVFTDNPRLRLPRVLRFHENDGSITVYDVDSEDDREMLAIAKYVSTLPESALASLVKEIENSPEV